MNNLTIYSDEELKIIQKLELDALKVVLEVCRLIHVECFAVGGTALGAIRHRGFIPWDDDIDIGMIRDDYVHFLNEAPHYLPPNYHLQTPYDNKINPYFYTKIRIDGTRFVEYSNHRLDIHQGVYIDIFPFDEVPDNNGENRRHFKKAQRLLNLFVLRQSPDMSKVAETPKEKLKCCIRRIMHTCVQIIPHDYLVSKIDTHVQKYNGTDQKAVSCLNVPVWKAEYVKKSDLYPLQKRKFEGVDVPIPKNYDVYLRTHYGNYMQLPPVEKRFGHKPYEIRFYDESKEKR